MTENKRMFPDFSRPASALGFTLPISIPIKREDGHQTTATIIIHIEFDGYNNQQVTIPESSRNILNRLGGNEFFKYVVGIAKAAHNVVTSMTRERWFKINEKTD